MARKVIDIGVAGNDGTGDSIREAFRKSNENFQELYAVFGQGGQIAFTDLADTPSTLLGNSNKITAVNSLGTALAFKELVGTGGVTVTSTDSTITIDNTSSNLQDDPTPQLQFSLNASNQLIGGLRSPTNESTFTADVGNFNTVYGTSYTVDDFAINRRYADNRYVNVSGDTMTGALSVPAGASGSQVPRASETVLKTGGTMSGALFLSDHPGDLAGSGNVNGADDLQAASKYYVDNSSYTSTINLFVSTSGDDNQLKTPPGKEGRSWAYSYRSVNKACQAAEELMDLAPLEPGPYRQLIAYGGGAEFSEVTNIGAGANGTVRIKFSNNGGAPVDQGAVLNTDIIAGKIVVGRTSGAKGIIYQYYGPDGATNSDFFDLIDVEGSFELGENLEFGEPVRTLQITIFIESGIYEEDYPIRIPQNVSIIGEELRRVIIRPADRPSRSPWADIWFRRDTEFDGLELTSTEFGYHYLTDPSDRASEPKNNKDIDVFMCNDAIIIRQITCQGHGGFMMVLDPEGQVLSKSPYVQQSGSFARSLNKQIFAGGQYVDGFAGNLPLTVDNKLSNTEVLVTGSERAPSTPASFVVNGVTYKVDTYIDDGTGFAGSRTLLKKNKEFIKAETIGYIDEELSPEFTFDRVTCQRDVGLIVDSLGYDLVLGTNLNSLRAGQAYFRGTQYDTLPDQKSQTLDALGYLKDQVFDLLVANNVAQTRADDGLAEILDIIDNGVSSSDAVVIPDGAGASTATNNAKDLLISNIPFIKEEVIAFIDEQYPSFTYVEADFKTNIENIIYAVAYDLVYGGNSLTVDVGSQFYDGEGTLLIPGQTLQYTEAINYVRNSLVPFIVQSQSVPFPKQVDVAQVLDNPNPGGSGDGATVQSLMGVINTIILGGRSAAPAVVYPTLSSYSSTLQDSRNLLVANRTSLQTQVIDYLNLRYSYNKNTCARDTGYIVEAIAHDIFYGGNLKTVQAALSYFNGTASARAVIETQLENTVAAIEYIKELCLDVVKNDAPAVRYQETIPQVVDTDIEDSSDPTATIESLFDEFLEVLNGATGYDDARSLLVQNKDFIKAEVTGFIAATYSTTVTATTSGTNQLTGSTTNLRAGMPIEFSGTVFGGIIAEQKYYVRTIVSPTAFTISTTPTGSALTLSTASGSMTGTLSYNETTCARDVGFIIANISADLLYGGRYNTIRAANRYYASSSELVISEQLTETIGAITYAKQLAVDILNQDDPAVSYQGLVSQVKDVDLDGTAAISDLEDRFDEFLDTLNNPLAAPAAIVYPTYKLLLSQETPFTTAYPDEITLLSAGNTSMCSNDFTQINDLGYGLVATNIGLIEAVSVFSYYCWTAYYANNGGQIRSLNGSNAHGEFGIVSEGSDPLEVPDSVTLSDDMIQVAKVYKTGPYVADNAEDDTAVIVYNQSYVPYNVSEIEINHGSGVISTVGPITGGSSYTNGTYTDVPLTTSGSGTGARATVVVVGGSVITVTITNGGNGYAVADTISALATSIGGTGSGFTTSIATIKDEGIIRYEVSNVTDVSATVPVTISSFGSKTGSGPYLVTFNIPSGGYKPNTGVNYTVSGNLNTAYNGVYTCTASTTTSITLSYPTDPGVYAGGTTTIWGQGNIIRLNLNTGGSNETSTAGLVTPLLHNQNVSIRSNQNFKVYNVDDVNPTRPSTALTFIDDPNGADDEALVYRVIAYGLRDPLNNSLAVDEAVLTFDSSYSYIKLLVDATYTAINDLSNPGQTYGSTQGDLAIAVERINDVKAAQRLNSGDMQFAWDGKMHRVLSYTDLGPGQYGIVRFDDVAGKNLNSPVITGLQSPVDPVTNSGLREAPTIRVGLAADEAAEIVVRISTCRVTGHDFLDIGTGGYNSTNYPGKIYGPGTAPDQGKEVVERTRGRCFYVTTDQDGIFRVGRFFTVDQGTGRVTFAAAIALSNLDGLGFKRGVVVSEFSNDDTFTDEANDTLPTESATQGYIDRRLGLDRDGNQLDPALTIGPGYLDREGRNAATADLNIGGFKLENVGAPASDTDAANKLYVDSQELADTSVTFTGKADNDLILYDNASSDWINVANNSAAITNTSSSSGGGSDISVAHSGNTVTLKLKGGLGTGNPITNHHVNDNAAIAQSKLNMNAATTRANATGIAQADRGLASFNSNTFTVTDGWVELQTSSSATTGVTLNKIQRIGNNTILGNLSGSSASPSELTPGNVVTAGDGIKNAPFTTSGAMTVTAGAPNTYSVTAITTTGAADSLVKTTAGGAINVQQLQIDGFKFADIATTTLELTTPGGVNFLTAVGASAGTTTISTAGTLAATNLSTSGSATFNPSNASISIQPSGTGTATIAPATVGSINNMNIGAVTRGSGAFTSLTSNGATTFTAGTASSSTSTGSLVVTGGVGISGNLYVGGTINGNITGTVTGNAASATQLQTARNINGVSFNGTADISINLNNSVTFNNGGSGAASGSSFNGGGALTVSYNTVGAPSTTGTNASGTWAINITGNAATISSQANSATITATSSNTANQIVLRDGSGNFSAGVMTGTATAARYADLAEKYLSDKDYEVGTVVIFGGEQEITTTTLFMDTRVAGVISEKPAHLMNSELQGDYPLAVALTGRVPVKVIGKVKKGDILVAAAKQGYAIATANPTIGSIIGKALANKDDNGEGIVEVVVGRF